VRQQTERFTRGSIPIAADFKLDSISSSSDLNK